jgi:hypothetical protein
MLALQTFRATLSGVAFLTSRDLLDLLLKLVHSRVERLGRGRNGVADDRAHRFAKCDRVDHAAISSFAASMALIV